MEMTEQSGITLIQRMVNPMNIELAKKKVQQNKGAPGIDGMTVKELDAHLREYLPYFKEKLLNGTYQPQPVKRVSIPKADGSKGHLGIPCVRDRLVQQMILQIIEPEIDGYFSDNSYGFRKGRNAHQAIVKVQSFYEEGYRWVVDCDLKSYFDTINHQKLQNRLQWHIKDKVILKLIWKFLRAGILDGDNFYEANEGTPQGGPLSSLLANVYLDQLDKELERRGHKFVRYADDFVIYVKSKRAGERVMEGITDFVEKKLLLTVNQKKSKITTATQSSFLGFHIQNHMGKSDADPHGRLNKDSEGS